MHVVCGVIAARVFATSSSPVSSSTSASTGRAPIQAIEPALAKKVKGEVTTWSPAFTPSARRPRISASVPFETPTPGFATRCIRAKSASKRSTSGPST
jgi:hypothetical protein